MPVCQAMPLTVLTMPTVGGALFTCSSTSSVLYVETFISAQLHLHNKRAHRNASPCFSSGNPHWSVQTVVRVFSVCVYCIINYAAVECYSGPKKLRSLPTVIFFIKFYSMNFIF